MITIQNYNISSDKPRFLYSAITKHQTSDIYLNAKSAFEYYLGKDENIMNRSLLFLTNGGIAIDRFKANNKVPSEFFKKIVQQKVSYLLGNGLTIDDKIKDKLGKKFDITLQRAGRSSSFGAVSFVYFYVDGDKLSQRDFSILEFVPVWDEDTGELVAGIRYWKLDKTSPLHFEFYELDGVTEYKKDNKNGIVVVKEKQDYIEKVFTDSTGKQKIGSQNFNMFPVIPLWNNDIKTSDFTTALKSKIDLYDIVLSDFGNNLEDNNDVYWVIKNYQGQTPEEFLQQFKQYKMLRVQGDGDAKPQSFETPYQARQVALDIIKQEIYKQSMALDTSILAGGSLTNIAIKANMVDLGLKCDEFEFNVLDFIDNVLALIKEYFNIDIGQAEPKFIRRDLINDTEIIQNIMTMRSDISHKTALSLNPYIENVDEELREIETERMDKFTIEEPVEEIIEEV